MDDQVRLEQLLRGLPALVALADAGTMTAAAERLGVPQPTFSRVIARLGASLGTPVVTRTGRGVELSPAARAMLPHARRALEAAGAALEAVDDRADLEDRTVAVAFQTALGQSLLPEVLRELTVVRPDVHYALDHGSRQRCLELVAERWADVALVSPPPADPGLASVVLLRQPLVLAVPRGHRLAEREAIRVAEIGADPVIALRPEYGLRGLTDRLFAAAGIAPTVAFEGDDIETIRGLVGAGLGVSVLPPATHPAAEVVEIPLRDRRATREIAACWPSGTARGSAVGQLRELLVVRGERGPDRA